MGKKREKRNRLKEDVINNEDIKQSSARKTALNSNVDIVDGSNRSQMKKLLHTVPRQHFECTCFPFSHLSYKTQSAPSADVPKARIAFFLFRVIPRSQTAVGSFFVPAEYRYPKVLRFGYHTLCVHKQALRFRCFPAAARMQN